MEKHQPYKIPPVIDDSYIRLYDLVQNRSDNGRLKAADVADYLGMSVDAFRRCIQSGSVPFAFANSKSGRAESYIPILPFYSWAVQRIFGIDSLRTQGREETP